MAGPARPRARRKVAAGRGPRRPRPVRAKEVRRADRFVQLAAAAADEAVDSAGGIEALRGDPDRCGTVIGTGVGGLDTICEQHQVLLEKGPARVSPFLVPMIMCNRASADISMRYGLRGPCETTVTACAAGAQSIANAGRLIATGRCDVMLAGGSRGAPIRPRDSRVRQHDGSFDAQACPCRLTSTVTASSSERGPA